MKISRKEAAERLDQIHQAAYGVRGISRCAGVVTKTKNEFGEDELQCGDCSRKGIYRLESELWNYNIPCCAEHANINTKSNLGFEDSTVYLYEMAVKFPPRIFGLAKTEDELLEEIGLI